MIPRGPFQLLEYCDSAILCPDHVSHTANREGQIQVHYLLWLEEPHLPILTDSERYSSVVSVSVLDSVSSGAGKHHFTNASNHSQLCCQPKPNGGAQIPARELEGLYQCSTWLCKERSMWVEIPSVGEEKYSLPWHYPGEEWGKEARANLTFKYVKAWKWTQICHQTKLFSHASWRAQLCTQCVTR